MEPQQKNQYILNQEVRLLEKQKKDLLHELERIELSHREAYTQHTTSIKELSKRESDLLDGIEIARKTLTSLTDSYELAKTELTKFKEAELRDINAELEEKRVLTKAITDKALDTKAEAGGLLRTAKLKETGLETREDALTQQQAQYNEDIKMLDERQKNEDQRRTSAETSIKLLEEKLAEINESIRIVIDQKVNLCNEIKEMKDKQDIEAIAFKEREDTIIVKEKANANRAEMLDKQAKEIEEGQRLLVDQRGSLERAVAEMKKKGVVI